MGVMDFVACSYVFANFAPVAYRQRKVYVEVTCVLVEADQTACVVFLLDTL